MFSFRRTHGVGGSIRGFGFGRELRFPSVAVAALEERRHAGLGRRLHFAPSYFLFGGEDSLGLLSPAAGRHARRSLSHRELGGVMAALAVGGRALPCVREQVWRGWRRRRRPGGSKRDGRKKGSGADGGELSREERDGLEECAASLGRHRILGEPDRCWSRGVGPTTDVGAGRCFLGACIAARRGSPGFSFVARARTATSVHTRALFWADAPVGTRPPQLGSTRQNPSSPFVLGRRGGPV